MTSIQKPELSIIIVNYNTKELIYNCIVSIKEYTHNLNYEIIVVDNASQDDSIESLKQSFSDITIFASPQNVGFGRANNIGADLAKGEILFLLNSDTIIIDNSIKTLYTYLINHLETGVCGGILLNADGSVGYSASHQLSLLSDFKSFFPFLKREPIETNLSSVIDVDYIIGADMMIKKQVFKEVGGFDPDFFLYCEEAELSFRVKKHKYKIQLIPTAKIIHLEGKSSKNDPFISHEKWCGRFLYFRKVYSPRHPFYLYLLYSVQCFIAVIIFQFNSSQRLIWSKRFQNMNRGFKKYRKLSF